LISVDATAFGGSQFDDESTEMRHSPPRNLAKIIEYAAFNADVETVRALQPLAVDSVTPDLTSNTSILLAVRERDEEALKHLLRSDIKLSRKNKKILFSKAIRDRNKEVFTILVERLSQTP